MKDSLRTFSAPSSEDMEKRYSVAEHLQQGLFSQKIAANTTVIPHWLERGERFWYVREFIGQGKEFRIVDVEAKTNNVAFNHEHLAAALAEVACISIDPLELPVTSLEFLPDDNAIVFEAFGAVWRYDETERRCSASKRYEPDWLISPDQSQALFLRDHNLWVRDLASGAERALTTGGEPYNAYSATPTAWGIGQSASPDAIWSPDSKRILTLQMDTRRVETAPLMQYAPSDGGRPRILEAGRRFAVPGDQHIDAFRIICIAVEDGAIQAANGASVAVFRNALGYFTQGHGWWAADSQQAFYIEIERGGDHRARLMRFDTRNGSVSVVIDEASPDVCFKLRLDSRVPIHARPLGKNGDVLWFSERTGWGHLYRYNSGTGAFLNAVTEGEWLVREIHFFNTRTRELLIQTAGRIPDRNPYYRDLCWVNVDTGAIREVLAGDADHVVFDCATEMGANLGLTRDVTNAKGVSPSGRYVVATRSRVDQAPESFILNADGDLVMDLETADTSGLPTGWSWPESFCEKGADGETDIWGVLYRPPHYQESVKYPVFDMSLGVQEGGAFPAGAFTNNALAGLPYFTGASLAALGMIVVDIYTRGTANRSKAFYGHIDIEAPDGAAVADRIAVIRALAAKDPSLDLKRVGAGGSVSTPTAVTGLLGAPDFYKVGVTNGAALDMRLQPAFVGEAYADLPARLRTYRSVSDFAERLEGKLLVMHGMMNPTSSVAMAFQLIDALQTANRSFDMLLLPNDGYGMSSYAMRRSWDYIVEHLLQCTPPPNYKLTTGMDLVAAFFAEKAELSRNREPAVGTE